MEINEILAENLNKLRTERNLSLTKLATLCGVSKVMLSQIEKGDTNPTINTICKIAQGLKVPYTYLLEHNEHQTSVVRKEDISPQIDKDDHYRIFCFYSNTAHRNFELFQMELDSGFSHTSPGHMEKAQEYVMVLEGMLEMTVRGKTYTVAKDDTIMFSSSVIHTYKSVGKEMLKSYIINYYPA